MNKKRVKQFSNRRYDKNCLKIAKKIVHLRDKDICQKCLKYVTGSNCQCSHVLSDGKNTRLSVDPMNMKILCHYCHMSWWHKEPLIASEWFKEKFPERYEYLIDKNANCERGSISLLWRENTYNALLTELAQYETIA